MTKKLNLIALMILLMGQVILGPLGTGIVRAETPSTPVGTVTNDAVTEELVVTPDAAVTEESVVTPDAAVTEEPIVTLDAAVTEEPIITPDAAVTEEPIVTPDAAVTEEPEVTPDAAVTEEPIVTPDAAVTEEPEVTPDDAVTEEPEVTSDDAVTEAPPSEEGATSNSMTNPGNQWGGTVTVQKVDQKGNPLKGVTFKLEHPGQYPGDVAREAVTDKDGIAKFEDLHNGSHTLTELSPQGYELCSTAPKPFVIADEHSGKKHHVFTFINAKIGHCEDMGDGKINIKKQFEDGTTQALSATFGLFNSQGVQIDTKTTGKDGLASFTGLDFGTYTVKETEAPEGYSIANIEGQLVTIGVEGKIINLEPIINLKNKTIVNVVLTKVDKANSAVTLPNAVFELYKKGSHTSWEKQAGTYTTDANGQIKEKLGEGTYKFKEITAPERYEIEGNGETGTFEVTNSSGTPHELFVTNAMKKETGKIIIDKSFEGLEGVLPGAEFELFTSSNESLRKVTTGPDGKAEFTGLTYGTYTLKELKAPPGYAINTEYMGNGKEITISHNEKVVTKEITNNKKRNKSIIVLKIDEKYNWLFLKGATFTLFDSDGKQVGESKATNRLGLVEFGELPFGTYKLQEVIAPNGYVISEEYLVGKEIEIGPEEWGKKVIVKNKQKQSGVTLTKYENGTDQVLEGATFDLYKKELTLRYPFYSYQKVASDMKTGKDGTINIPDQGQGDYYFEETAAPDGYEIAGNNKTHFKVGRDGADVAVAVYNKAITGSITLFKTDAEGNPLNGAVFDFYKDGVLVEEGIEMNGEPIGEIVRKGLRVGNYSFVETAAPDGYMRNATPQEVTISDESREASVTLVNRIAEGSVTFTKVDGNDKLLPGAVFMLDYRAPGASKYESLGVEYTSETGEFHIGNLAFGDYQLHEVKAPQYYVRDYTPREFSIGQEEGQQIDVELREPVMNEKGGNIIIEKVDADNTEIKLSGAVFQLFDGDEMVAEATTGEDGIARFEGVAYGSYSVKEVTPPSGYVVIPSEDNQTVTLVEGTDEAPLVVVANKKIHESFTVLKVNAANPSGPGLPGAVFKVMVRGMDTEAYVDVEGMGNLVTNVNGVIPETKLPPGVYRLIEIGAPAGYTLNSTPTPFTIEKNQTAITALIIKNNLIPVGGGGDTTPIPDSPGTETPQPEGPIVTVPETPQPEGPIVTIPETPQPEGPIVTVPETPQPEGPIVTVPETPQPEGPIVTVPETPRPEGPIVTVPETPQPEGPIVTVPETPQPEGPSVIVVENSRPEAPIATPVVSKTLPKTGEKAPLNLLISGLALAVLGGWLLFGRRKKAIHNSKVK